MLPDQLDIMGHTRSFETTSVGNSEMTNLHEQMRRLEDKISKVELAQDSLRPVLRNLVPTGPKTARGSISPLGMSFDHTKQVEAVRVKVETQIKASNKLMSQMKQLVRKFEIETLREVHDLAAKHSSSGDHLSNKQVNARIEALQERVKENVTE